MAKLSARGRHELARLEYETTDAIKLDPDITFRKRVYAFMSDGHVLKRDSVRFANNGMTLSGELYTWPWKDQGNVGLERFETLQKVLFERGYKCSKSK